MIRQKMEQKKKINFQEMLLMTLFPFPSQQTAIVKIITAASMNF